jgi:peptide-methionine (S)-S-oxide reductase
VRVGAALGVAVATWACGRGDARGVGGQRPASRAEVVLAGGCYWGTESVFRHVRGVTSVTSGFAIPATPDGARFEAPAEAVRLTYDPTRITYRQLLDVFFSVAHDPTQVNRQGPDVGAEYRSVVFVDGDGERGVVRRYIDSLSAARVYPRPIATQIAALQSFQDADFSQQDYAARHPTDPYIVINDVPKVAALKRRFPQLYRD